MSFPLINGIWLLTKQGDKLKFKKLNLFNFHYKIRRDFKARHMTTSKAKMGKIVFFYD